MTEAPQITVHLPDGHQLTETQIAQERESCKGLLARTPLPYKPLYATMNRAYLKGLRGGETRREAEHSAAHAAGMVAGFLIGTLFTMLFVGFFGWIYGMAQTAGVVQVVTAAIVWISLFCLGFSKVHRPIFRRIASAFRWLKSRLKRKEEAS